MGIVTATAGGTRLARSTGNRIEISSPGEKGPWFKSQERIGPKKCRQALFHLFFIESLTQQVFTEHLLCVGHVPGNRDTIGNKAETIPVWRSSCSTGMDS